MDSLDVSSHRLCRELLTPALRLKEALRVTHPCNHFDVLTTPKSYAFHRCFVFHRSPYFCSTSSEFHGLQSNFLPHGLQHHTRIAHLAHHGKMVGLCFSCRINIWYTGISGPTIGIYTFCRDRQKRAAGKDLGRVCWTKRRCDISQWRGQDGSS